MVVALLLCLIVLCGSIAFATPARADEVGISTVPAAADGKPDGRTRFTYLADPGQKLSDHFLVTNTGTTKQTYTVVGTDAFNDAKGDYALLPTSATPTGIGTWVHFENGSSRMSFVLDPGASRSLAFSVDVPKDATPGDHVGGILASVVTPGSEVSLDRRVATRLYTRISGQLQPILTVSSIAADWNGAWWNPLTGAVTLHYLVKNTGNIALAANTSASVRTWFGIPVGTTATRPLSELLPGQSAAVDVSLSGVAQWAYLNPGVTLRPFVETQDSKLAVPAPIVSRDTFLFALPWSLLILIAAGIGVYFLLRWRRRRDEVRAQEWMDFVELNAAANVSEPGTATALAGSGKANDS